MKHCPTCKRNWATGRICPYCDCELVAGSSPARCSVATVESWELFARNSVNEIAKLVVSNQQQDEPTTCERCILNLCHGILEKQKPQNAALCDAATKDQQP